MYSSVMPPRALYADNKCETQYTRVSPSILALTVSLKALQILCV